MRALAFYCLISGLFPAFAGAADFDLAAGYAQSHDFWQTVHDVQDRTGNLSEIQDVLRNRYGKPDLGFSYLDAAYAYPHSYFDSQAFSHLVIGTRAEALAGGEVSNPISPEIQAYADSIGITSVGFRSGADAIARGSAFWEMRLLGGLGSEKRVYAQGAEFIDSIPVRSGTLLLGGVAIGHMSEKEFGDNFFITSHALLRGVYFHSSVDAPRSRPDEKYDFATWRWRLQNEWLGETETPLSSRTRYGIVSVLGQNPVPFLDLPVTWDYQQRLKFFPGMGSVSGLGGIVRLLSANSLPNLALYGGLFGGGLGAGLDLQLGSVLLHGATYSIENLLTESYDNTRVWQANIGIAL